MRTRQFIANKDKSLSVVNLWVRGLVSFYQFNYIYKVSFLGAQIKVKIFLLDNPDVCARVCIE